MEEPMRKPTLLLVAAGAALGLLLPAFAAAEPRTYSVDRAHSNVKFTIRHLVSDVEGRFGEFEGKVTYDPQAPEKSSVEMVVQAASIDTGADRRDDHLRSPDFFEVEKYPTLSFQSVSVEPESAKKLRVTGDLSIHGVTKRVTIPVDVLGTMPFRGGEKAGFRTTFTVDRKDYGVTWNRNVDQGGVLLGDEVEITIRLESDWAPPEPAPAAQPGG
jgi:polyisoprenoid-binding protein YceI